MSMDLQKIEHAVETAILKEIHSGNVFTIPYANRVDISGEFNKAHRNLDYDRIFARMGELLEEEIARKIVNKIVTEMAGDIKKLMGNPAVRDDLRFFMRSGVQKILDNVKGGK